MTPPWHYFQLRLVDERGDIVDIGEDGEIQVKTYSFLKEYRTLAEKTRQLFTDDGFLRTGYSFGIKLLDNLFISFEFFLLNQSKINLHVRVAAIMQPPVNRIAYYRPTVS